MRVRRCFAGIVYDAVGMVSWLWVMMGVDVNPGWEGVCVGDIMSMREGRLVGKVDEKKKNKRNKIWKNHYLPWLRLECSSL